VLKLASALVAVSLFVSPALASEECPSPAETINNIPVAPLVHLQGENVKPFLANATKYLYKNSSHIPPAEDVTDVLIFPRPDGQTDFFALFVKGCGAGMGVFMHQFLQDLLKAPGEPV
jgi:hypothetical protein